MDWITWAVQCQCYYHLSILSTAHGGRAQVSCEASSQCGRVHVSRFHSCPTGTIRWAESSVVSTLERLVPSPRGSLDIHYTWTAPHGMMSQVEEKGKCAIISPLNPGSRHPNFKGRQWNLMSRFIFSPLYFFFYIPLCIVQQKGIRLVSNFISLDREWKNKHGSYLTAVCICSDAHRRWWQKCENQSAGSSVQQ